MSWYDDPRFDLLVRMGSADGASLHVAHLGRVVDSASWGRSAVEGRIEGCWPSVAVKTTVKGSRSLMFRELEIDPDADIECLWHGDLYVKGRFREIERETSRPYAEVAWTVWPVQQRCLRELPGFVDPDRLEVFWDGDERWMIELRQPGCALLRVRAMSSEELEEKFIVTLSEHMAAWEADEMRNVAVESLVMDVAAAQLLAVAENVTESLGARIRAATALRRALPALRRSNPVTHSRAVTAVRAVEDCIRYREDMARLGIRV